MRLKHVHIFLFALAAILLVPSSGQALVSQSEQHIKVSLRMIGHQVLLNSGDSISLVLPINKESDRYRIRFDTEFDFNPDELVNTVNRIIRDTKTANGYIMEVEQCETDEVVYSFEMGNLENMDIIPCKKRNLPRDCYTLLFTLLEHKESSAAGLITATSDPSDKVYSGMSKLSNSIITLMAILLMTGLFFFLWNKRSKSQLDPNLIPLGKFQFDKKNTELITEHQKIDLTGKEGDLLLLLYNAVNTTVQREVILNMVWGDEGEYVGRTLDVFISKLRKKLVADPNVKIVNIRGLGYKLVLDV